MISILAVPTTDVDMVWGVVAPMLDKALQAYGGECTFTIDHVYSWLTLGQWELFVAFDGEYGIVGAVVVSYTKYPLHTVGHVVLTAGRKIISKDSMSQLSKWLKHRGVTVLQAHCNDAVTRLYRPLNIRKVANLTEIVL